MRFPCQNCVCMYCLIKVFWDAEPMVWIKTNNKLLSLIKFKYSEFLLVQPAIMSPLRKFWKDYALYEIFLVCQEWQVVKNDLQY
jgi:hypothetical protein